MRFNIQQALLLDIVLIIPSFFGQIGRAFPLEMQAMGSNFFFYLCTCSWFAGTASPCAWRKSSTCAVAAAASSLAGLHYGCSLVAVRNLRIRRGTGRRLCVV